MLDKLVIWFAWIYWYTNRPFVAAFTEALLGYGEGDLKVHGHAIARKMTRYLHELQPQVFLKLVATIALLPCMARLLIRARPSGASGSNCGSESKVSLAMAAFSCPARKSALPGSTRCFIA